MNDQNTTSTIDVAALAAELAQVNERLGQLENRKKQLQAALRPLGIGRHPAGDANVSISPNRRVDPVKVEAAYPSSQYPHFYALKPELTIVRKNVTPAMYEALMSEQGEPIVKIV